MADTYRHYSGSSEGPATGQSQLEWLTEIISDDLSAVIRRAPPLEGPSSDCLLSDIGDFLVDAQWAISRMAQRIVESRHVTDYIRETIQDSSRTQGYSDTKLVEYLDQKYSHLTSLQALLGDSSTGLQHSWSSAPAMPSYSTNSSYAEGSSSYSGTSPDAQSWYSSSQTVNYELAAGVAQTQLGDEAPELEETLKTRGKGSYYCPRGESCTKGGVGPDGELVVFHRNSEYRAHLQKHDKPFKCDLPGCHNKKGFARIDQLRRHQESVQHYS